MPQDQSNTVDAILTAPRILVIYAGGTIGMVSSEHGLVPSDNLEAVLDTALSGHRNVPQYDFLNLSPLIDSSNAQPDNWQQLANTITQNQAYSSFVVLHGTDTLAYTSSALSFLCSHLKKRIVVTGSQIPVVQKDSDGVSNFIGALELSQQTPEFQSGCVRLYFGGKDLAANRSRKTSSRNFEAFSAANGEKQNNVEQYDSEFFEEHFGSDIKPILAQQNEAVGLLYFYPGISSAVVKAIASESQLKAIILVSFGAGNIPSDNKALLQELIDANKKDITLINISQCAHGGVNQGLYEAGDVLSQCNVISGADMTLEAAFTKLHFLIAQNLSSKNFRTALKLNLCGELTQQKQKT